MIAPLTYPGKIPPWSYLLAGGRVRRVTGEGDLDLGDRTAVLASGSNAAPARLAEKCGRGAVIPVLRVEMPGIVVYSAHITRYGSIAATWMPDDHASSWVSVPFFDDAQLARVDASEGNYRRSEIGTPPALRDRPLSAYVSARGVLQLDHRPIRLSEVESTSRLSAMSQRRVLDHVAVLTGAAADGASLSAGVQSGDIDPAEVNGALS